MRDRRFQVAYPSEAYVDGGGEAYFVGPDIDVRLWEGKTPPGTDDLAAISERVTQGGSLKVLREREIGIGSWTLHLGWKTCLEIPLGPAPGAVE